MADTPETQSPSLGMGLDCFWEEWNCHRDGLQQAVQQYLDKQECLLKQLVHVKDGSDTPKTSDTPKSTEVPARRSDSKKTTLSSGTSSISASNFGMDVNVLRTSAVLPGSSESDPAASSKFSNNYNKLKRQDSKRLKTNKLLEITSTKGLPRIEQFMRWWGAIEEPPRSGYISAFIHHKFFNFAVWLVIAANALYTVYQLNYEMEHLGLRPPSADMAEIVFFTFYSLELVLKLYVHRQYFFCNEDMTWNIFDLLLVAFSSCDLLLIIAGDAFINITFARTLRIFKVAKILRVFRAMRFMKVLRVMMSSILGSFVSLFWSFVMIGLILYVFALYFMQQMVVELEETFDIASPVWQQQHFFFRSVERTVLTLMQSTMGGLDWDVVYRLIEPLGWPYMAAYIFYIAFFNFALINILTGIFVENAMKLCGPDDDELVFQQKQQKTKDSLELRRIAQSMDADGDGFIDKDEFVRFARHEDVASRLAAMDIHVRDADVFYNMITAPDFENVLPVDEFVARAANLKGSASSTDLHHLIFQTSLMQQGLQTLWSADARPEPIENSEESDGALPTKASL